MAKPQPIDHHAARAAVRLALCAVVALIVGCRSVDNAQVDLMERELRQQEDYIYELEDYLMEYSEKLRQYRMMDKGQPIVTSTPVKKKSATKEPELIVDPPRTSRPAPHRAGGSSTFRRPGIEAPTNPADDEPVVGPAEAPEAMEAPAEPAVDPTPAPETPDPEKMKVPDLDIGAPAAAPTSALPWKKAQRVATTPAADPPPVGDDAPPFIPDPVDYQVEAEAPTAAPADEQETAPVEDSPADTAEPMPTAELEGPILPPAADPTRLESERLEVRHVFTQPSLEDAAAPGSLLAVVEALNATNEPVDASGTISLMIMAPDETGALRRVDRWDFTAEETAAAWQSSRLGDGLHLQLPLGAAPLPAGRLELWARLVGADGKKLLTRTPFEGAELVALDDAMAAEETVVAENGETASPVVEGAETAEVAEAKEALPAPTWRAATQAIADGTAGPARQEWTPHGSTPTPRVASESAQDTPTKWQGRSTIVR